MENNIFTKKLKVGTIILASIVTVLLIIWFVSRGEYYGKTHDSDNRCFNDINYFDAMSFDDAIKSAYAASGINEDPMEYINYEETLKIKYYRKIPVEWWFTSIDNYRLFMSDESTCNQGKESLKSFICKIKNDEMFLKDRSANGVFEQMQDESLPTFQFHYMLTPIYCGNKICGAESVIYSWDEISDNSANFVITAGMDVWNRYTFTRVDGLWYLTGFFEPGELY